MTPPASANYQVPTELYDVLSQLHYEEGLPADDPRYVDTLAARNSQDLFQRLAKRFGYWQEKNMVVATQKTHLLFFGHIGSGKTTELRHYAQEFNRSGLYCALEVNVNERLDRNNCQFPDLLLAMAQSLLEVLHEEGILLGDAQLQPLLDWFKRTVETRIGEHALHGEVKTGAESKLSLLGLGKLFASATASFRTGATYRNEVRDEIRNSFGQLAEAFNDFLRVAEQALEAERGVKRILFILDGTDKLRDEDSRRLFELDIAQMQQIDTLALYTAPLHLAYDGNVGSRIEHMILPMIKLYAQDGSEQASGWEALSQILLRRADRSLFADNQVIRTLVEHSGGHPRELLCLLKYCCEIADDRIDSATAEQAIDELAAEYRRFLEPEDYTLLAARDQDKIHGGNDERGKKLLYKLALLEYNHGSWQRSHPVIRRLEGYQRAKQAAADVAGN